MGENASQIEREIMAERSELGRNLEVLETKARDLADWRVHYRNHAGVFLGVAAGAGVLLGIMSHGRRNGSFGYVSYATPERPPKPRRPLSERLNGPKSRQLMDTFDNAANALLAVGVAKAVDFLSSYLPGFSDEYRRSSEASGKGFSASSWPDQPVTRSAGGFDADPARNRWDTGQADR